MNDEELFSIDMDKGKFDIQNQRQSKQTGGGSNYDDGEDNFKNELSICDDIYEYDSIYSEL